MILRNIWLSAKFLQTWLDFFFFYHSVGVDKPCLPALGHVWMLARRTWPLLNAPISPEWKKKSMKRPREYINAARRRRQTGWKADRCYVKLQAPFSLCGCGFRCSFTSLWPHLSQHPSVILSFFPAHSSTAFSLSPPSRSACTPCVCVCVLEGWSFDALGVYECFVSLLSAVGHCVCSRHTALPLTPSESGPVQGPKWILILPPVLNAAG